jgi:hypothetical protein
VPSDKKIRTGPAAKSEPTPKDTSASNAASTKAGSSEAPGGAAPANYSRGEGQKPVSQAYRDNWNAIYAKKTKKKR